MTRPTTPAALPCTTAATQAQADAQVQAQDARLAFLFRGALREGRIHPLQHLVQRHRAEHPQVLSPASTRGAAAA